MKMIDLFYECLHSRTGSSGKITDMEEKLKRAKVDSKHLVPDLTASSINNELDDRSKYNYSIG